MASISWSIFDGSSTSGCGYLIAKPFMQLSYLFELLFMQLSYMTEYLDSYFHGLMMLVGTLAVLSFVIGLFCRMVFGGGDRSLIGRAFVLRGDVMTCLLSPFLYKWIDVRVNWLRGEHRRLVGLRVKALKPAIRDLQNRMINLYESKRVLDGIVYGFYDSETPTEKYKRYQSSRMEECSDPEYWQQINHMDSESEESSHQENDELQEMQDARERALQAARDAWHRAEVNSDWQRMEECEATINELTLL